MNKDKNKPSTTENNETKNIPSKENVDQKASTPRANLPSSTDEHFEGSSTGPRDGAKKIRARSVPANKENPTKQQKKLELPKWVPDESVTECKRCHSPFNFLRFKVLNSSSPHLFFIMIVIIKYLFIIFLIYNTASLSSVW
jgi:hypothetical protein